MRLFLDTADVEEIRKGVELGVISGVTTNPSLVARVKRPLKEVVREICALVPGPVSAEVLARDTAGMVEEARQLAAIAPNVVVKIPITEGGLRAVKVLAGEGIATNVTLVFSPNQALLAALAGATYVSPFVGRLDDVGAEGMEVVRTTVSIFRQYGFSTQVIAASIRHPMHVVAAAQAGAPVATLPYGVLVQMLRHPLTDVGIERFLADWAKVGIAPGS
ncbi:MAG: fructose-6-phosphate aldolase [Bacillota bacterium]|nr:fructose-6-phosphate aldolase [Bacillota bacterium]MDI7249462.1 fructose-6-phosphate aldolase [Bacillota bacterium]